MRSIALLLLVLGIGSCVVYFMHIELRLLRWIDTWGEEVAWGIRGGLIVVGGLLLMATKSKSKQK